MFKLKYIKLNDETFFDIPIDLPTLVKRPELCPSTLVTGPELDETFFDIPIGAVDSSVCVTSEDQANMPVNTSVPDKVILERGREGPRISAGGALGARDMSVGVVAQVTLRIELSRTGY